MKKDKFEQAEKLQIKLKTTKAKINELKLLADFLECGNSLEISTHGSMYTIEVPFALYQPILDLVKDNLTKTKCSIEVAFERL